MTEEQLWDIEEMSRRLDDVIIEIDAVDSKHSALEEKLMKIAEEWEDLDYMAIMGDRVRLPSKQQIIAILIRTTGKTSAKDLEMFAEIADRIRFRSMPRS